MHGQREAPPPTVAALVAYQTSGGGGTCSEWANWSRDLPPVISLTTSTTTMPSIKKRVTGFIRQFSAPAAGGGGGSAANQVAAGVAAKEAVKGKSKSCAGGVGVPSSGPCKSPKIDPSKCQDGFIQRYLNG